MPTFGLFRLITLILGNMIGSGILLLPATLAPLGRYGLWSYGISCALAIALALVFALLSRQYPLIGGPYTYCRLAFGERSGALCALLYWLGTIIGNAATIAAGTAYLSGWFPALNHPHTAFYINIAVLWLLTAINVADLGTMAIIQVIGTLLQLLPLIAMPLIWMLHGPWHWPNPEPLTPITASSALAHGTLLTFWAFIGLESATIPADATTKPQRTIALATLLGTGIGALCYLLNSAALFSLIPLSALHHSQAPFALGFAPFIPHSLPLMSLIGAVSCFISALGWILLQGQIPLAVAQQGWLPKLFLFQHKKQTPALALIASSAVIHCLLWGLSNNSLVHLFERLIEFSTGTFILVYFWIVLAAFKLKSWKNQ